MKTRAPPLSAAVMVSTMVCPMATNRRQHPPNPEIARRIKSALEWHEMSQADLARVLGYASASISQILSGATRPSDQTVKRIADDLATIEAVREALGRGF